MDLTVEMRKIIISIIALAQKTQEDLALRNLLQLTTNFLFILDTDKAAAYRIALAMEYLEETAALLPATNSTAVLEYLQNIKDKQLQDAANKEICAVICEFIDPNEINPQLVTFWLQRLCTIDEIKNMDALMLFLSADQQKRVFAFDKTFMTDVKLQQLMRCL